MAISMLKIRRPLGRLIFNMGIAIPGKTVFLIETAPRIHDDGLCMCGIVVLCQNIYTWTSCQWVNARNSNANALELRLSSTNPSIWFDNVSSDGLQRLLQLQGVPYLGGDKQLNLLIISQWVKGHSHSKHCRKNCHRPLPFKTHFMMRT